MATEKLPETKATVKPDAETISSWPYGMEGHEKKCVKRYCELANKTIEQIYNVAMPCMDDQQFKEEENGSVGELSTVCSHVLKCLSLARIGRLAIVCEQTCSCGNEKRIWSLTFVTHVNTGNIWYVGNTAQHCRLGLFQDSDFAGDLEDSK